jgi:hypothetical protein
VLPVGNTTDFFEFKSLIIILNSMTAFKTYKGNLGRIVKSELAGYADLVVEGGVGANINPLCTLRDSGYSKPYVRMDLFPSFRGKTIHAEPQSWADMNTGITYANFWNVYGNCFLPDAVRPAVKKFESKTPAFVSNNALVNALFDEDLDHFIGRKHSEDIIAIPDAVKNLSEIYSMQLHLGPCGFGIIMSVDYERKHRYSVAAMPGFDPTKTFSPMENLLVWDERDVNLQHHWHFERFKQFVEESERAGWEFYLPSESYDVLFMKKS